MFARSIFLLFLCASFSVQAQMYKWVEPGGKVTYSDKPPPPSVNNIETQTISTSTGNPTLPYELAQAVKKMPVTLYSSENIGQSNEARDFLKKNGIPFSEKTISTNDDIDKLREITGSAQVPVLYIGQTKLAGFNPYEWRSTLSQAGYPQSNVLPSNYRFAPPQPLVQKTVAPQPVKEVVNTQLTPPSQPAPVKSDTQNNSNGFQFQ